MKYVIMALAVAAAGLATAPAAHAVRRCEPLEIECHKVCTLPQYNGNIKDPQIYWATC